MTPVIQVVLGECDDVFELVGLSVGVDHPARPLAGQLGEFGGERHQLQRRSQPRSQEFDGVDVLRGNQIGRSVIGGQSECARAKPINRTQQLVRVQAETDAMLMTEQIVEGTGFEPPHSTSLATRQLVFGRRGFDLGQGEYQLGGDIVACRRAVARWSSRSGHEVAIAPVGAHLDCGCGDSCE